MDRQEDEPMPPPPSVLGRQMNAAQSQSHSQSSSSNPSQDGRVQSTPSSTDAASSRSPDSVPPRSGVGSSTMLTPPQVAPAGQAVATSGGGGSTSIADKSCHRCRERKVRCGREYPICKRCRKRHEECVFPDIVNIETTVDPSDDAERIVRLETKLASLEEQLSRIPPPSASSSSESPHPPNSASTSPQSSQIPLLSTSIAADLPTAIYLAVMRDTDHQQGATARMFLERLHGQASIGYSKPNWRLGVPSLARSLTFHLLQASLFACCSRLPSLQLIHKRIVPLRDELQVTDLLASLDASKRVAVTIICALGARSSPHSALMGVECNGLDDGTAPPSVILSAGMRRENAARGLTEQALGQCYGAGVLIDVTRENLEAVMGLIQLMIFEEVRPKKARFLLRNAIGMFKELQFGQSDGDLQEVRQALSPILFDFDSLIAAQLSIPCLITQSELDAYFHFAANPARGLRIPDFEAESIGTHLHTIVQSSTGRITHDILIDAVAATACWVSGAERKFATLSTVRAPKASSVLQEVRNLWKWIDDLHTAIQQLQQMFVNINYEIEGCEGDKWALDHYILLGVRADARLVDLVHLMHKFLEARFFSPNNVDSDADKKLWNSLRMESELRARKCLKLVAFYSNLYLSSRDKHVVYHLAMSMELLNNWPLIATQRVGDRFGPISSEYEATDEELDWLTRALQLACFYTPRAASKLQSLATGRQARVDNPSMSNAAPSRFVNVTDASAALMASGRTASTESSFAFSSNNASENFAPVASGSNVSAFPYGFDVTPSDTSYNFDDLGTTTGAQSPVDQMRDIARSDDWN